MTTKQQYNYEYLQQFCQENNITLSKDYSQEKITRDIKIEGKCKTELCTESFCKTFRQLIRTDAFCKGCTNKNQILITKQRNLEKYGCENPMQNKEVKEKTKQTCLEKYGCEYPLQNKKVKEKAKQSCLQKYGCENPSQNKNIKQRKKITCFKNYGFEYASQSEEIKDKMKITNLINYGVEYPLQNEDIKNKVKQTNLEKYGNICSAQGLDIQKKIKITNLEKYGFEYASQSEEIKEKTKQTCLQKYGVDSPCQNAEISEKASKNSYKSKDYIFPSGKSIQIQGYENFVLDEIFQNENILEEEDIVTCRTQVPEIWYLDSNSKKHRYYVDVFIPSQNRMIECKSTWTMKKGIEKDNIYLKQQACKDAGYSCEIWVYNSKGEKVECIL